jgi:crotonobetainyl-CoA:carnitine CoA-transferase CaiB-like acyl-CoA transferase
LFKLLQGLKVLDLTTVALGPYATQILGDFGADIIKVESREGDVFRAVRPGRRSDLGVGFINFNRNKRGIVLDLKQPEGQAILQRLAAGVDVVVHNMRTASAMSLGADYETLKAVNPRLVYCYSPGFGERGSDSHAPAYDDIIQARSGLAMLNADVSGVPQFVRTIACDKVVGLHLALAVMAGVIQQQRTGKSVNIEAPMLETMVSFLMLEHLAGHTLVPAEGELGYERLMSANRKPFRTSDGFVAILPYSTKHWIRFFQICGMEDWATDDRVIDPVLRSMHIDELYGKIAALAPTRSTSEWLTLLNEKDIPCARVSTLTDLFTDPHLVSAGMFHTVTDERVGTISEIRSPFEVDGQLSHEGTANAVAPGLGEHTETVLQAAGYSAAEIANFQRLGVIP